MRNCETEDINSRSLDCTKAGGALYIYIKLHIYIKVHTYTSQYIPSINIWFGANSLLAYTTKKQTNTLSSFPELLTLSPQVRPPPFPYSPLVVVVVVVVALHMSWMYVYNGLNRMEVLEMGRERRTGGQHSQVQFRNPREQKSSFFVSHQHLPMESFSLC